MEAIMEIGLLTILLVCLPEVQPYITHINAVVNEPVLLTCEIECLGQAKWINLNPIKADIADCDKGTCQFKDPFQKRFTLPEDRTRGNISLLIKPIIYNDKGSYSCICDGQQAVVKLNVFVPVVVTAHELESVLLPCYGDTRRDAKDLQWKQDKELVILYNRKSGNMTLGKGFEDRFGVSSEAFGDGDLCLHIDSVRQSDTGLYVCTIHDESTDGEPRAVLLKVEESSRSAWPGTAVGVVVVLLILFALIGVPSPTVIILLLRKKIISWQNIKGLFGGGAHREPSLPIQEESQNAPKSSTRVFHDLPQE